MIFSYVSYFPELSFWIDHFLTIMICRDQKSILFGTENLTCNIPSNFNLFIFRKHGSIVIQKFFFAAFGVQNVSELFVPA